MIYVFYLFAGSLFGIVLTKSEAVSWYRIQNMFAFQEAHLFLVIGSAIVTGMVSVYLLKKMKLKALLTAEEVKIPEKKFHRGYIFGGLIFGAGWAITGACPGPIFAQIGAGEIPGLITLGGAVLGTYLYSALRPKLPH